MSAVSVFSLDSGDREQSVSVDEPTSGSEIVDVDHDEGVLPLDHVSVLVTVSDSGAIRYRGTAFPIGGHGAWLTAKHCVTAEGQETFGLVSTTFDPRVVGTVREVVKHPELDLAILHVGSHGDRAVAAFTFSPGHWGNEVMVVGYPEDLVLDRSGKDRPRARILKGHIQRLEVPGPEADAEGDFELSFACPGGLSGSPVVLQAGQGVAGVVVGNRESSVVDSFVETFDSPQRFERLEVRRTVSSGMAVDLSRVTDWLAANGAA